MAQLLVKIELEGNPDLEAYAMLDRYMCSKFWERIRKPGSSPTGLTHAMYHASTFGDHPNITTMANELKRNIEFRVWDKAHVLMVQTLAWTETA